MAKVREEYPTQIANIVGSFGEGGIDYAFDCVGNPAILNQCLEMLDWGGTAVAVGVPAFDATVPAQVTRLTHVERTLTGSRAGSHRPHWDIPLIVQGYKQGLIKLDELVEREVPARRLGERGPRPARREARARRAHRLRRVGAWAPRPSSSRIGSTDHPIPGTAATRRGSWPARSATRPRSPCGGRRRSVARWISRPWTTRWWCSRDGGDTVAEGRRCDRLDVEPPPPVLWADAVAARDAAKATVHDHPFPTCFGCGPGRDDGLRLLPGLVAGRDDGVHAAPWELEPSLADARGEVGHEFVWAALDCPTGWAVILGDRKPRVLGRLAVDQRGPVELGYRYVVTAWCRATEGRKAFTEGALSTDTGNVQAVARATWIEVDPTEFNKVGG